MVFLHNVVYLAVHGFPSSQTSFDNPPRNVIIMCEPYKIIVYNLYRVLPKEDKKAFWAFAFFMYYKYSNLCDMYWLEWILKRVFFHAIFFINSGNTTNPKIYKILYVLNFLKVYIFDRKCIIWNSEQPKFWFVYPR